MNWYYAADGEHRGPVSQQELETLASQGDVTPLTLIWREGMTEWQEYSKIATPLPLVQEPAAEKTVQCANCGQSLAPTDSVSISGRGYCAGCKSAMVQRIREGAPVASSEAERTRKRFLKHEAAVKSIGTLYFFVGASTLLGGIAALLKAKEYDPVGVGILFAISLAFIALAPGLRSLKKTARNVTGVISGIGLLGFPFGTIANGYLLYLLFGQKGRMVFSNEYKRVIRETPDIKCRTSPIIVILMVVAMLLLLLGIGVAFTDHQQPSP